MLGQPRRSIKYGPSSNPRIVPILSPPKISATAPERSDLGNILATISVAALGATASPTPTAARESTRVGTENAKAGIAAVAKDHMATPAGSMARPPKRAARKPPGS